MSALSLHLPESLQKQVRELADREGISINQFVTTAVAEKMSALLTEEYLGGRAERGSREKFERVLDKIMIALPMHRTRFDASALIFGQPRSQCHRASWRWTADHNDCKMRIMEAVMIELTEQQLQAIESSDATSPRLVNPRTKETFVLLRLDEYERLKEGEYDDSPWTREELQTLAWEAGKYVGWEDMDEYDDVPEKP